MKRILIRWWLRARVEVLRARVANGKANVRESEAQFEQDKNRLWQLCSELRTANAALAMVEDPRRLLSDALRNRRAAGV